MGSQQQPDWEQQLREDGFAFEPLDAEDYERLERAPRSKPRYWSGVIEEVLRLKEPRRLRHESPEQAQRAYDGLTQAARHLKVTNLIQVRKMGLRTLIIYKGPAK